MPLDLSLCLVPAHCPVTPFHLLVSPKMQLRTPWGPPSFHGFINLPPELRHHIYNLCNLSTLFQLMHTTGQLRAESSPIFWSRQNTIHYRVDPIALQYYTRNQPGLITHCPGFASKVTTLEVDLSGEGDAVPELWTMLENEADDEGDDAAIFKFWHRIWAAVRALFPAAKTVVIRLEHSGLRAPPGSPDLGSTANALIKTAMGLAPAGITPLLAWANEDDPHPCELWRMDGEKQWVLVRKAWMPWRATLPQRTWTPDGGLGDFLTWRKVSFFARIEDAGLEELRRGIHTWYTRRAKRDDSQIDSAEPRGDIEVHTDSDSAFDGLWMGFQTVSPWYHRDTYHVDTPADVRAILDMRQERVDRLRASAGLLEGRLSEAAREDRRAFEELFFAQMEEQKCVAPGTSPEHSWFWTHVASRALYR